MFKSSRDHQICNWKQIIYMKRRGGGAKGPWHCPSGTETHPKDLTSLWILLSWSVIMRSLPMGLIERKLLTYASFLYSLFCFKRKDSQHLSNVLTKFRKLGFCCRTLLGTRVKVGFKTLQNLSVNLCYVMSLILESWARGCDCWEGD